MSFWSAGCPKETFGARPRRLFLIKTLILHQLSTLNTLIRSWISGFNHLRAPLLSAIVARLDILALDSRPKFIRTRPGCLLLSRYRPTLCGISLAETSIWATVAWVALDSRRFDHYLRLSLDSSLSERQLGAVNARDARYRLPETSFFDLLYSRGISSLWHLSLFWNAWINVH